MSPPDGASIIFSFYSPAIIVGRIRLSCYELPGEFIPETPIVDYCLIYGTVELDDIIWLPQHRVARFAVQSSGVSSCQQNRPARMASFELCCERKAVHCAGQNDIAKDQIDLSSVMQLFQSCLCRINLKRVISKLLE